MQPTATNQPSLRQLAERCAQQMSLGHGGSPAAPDAAVIAGLETQTVAWALRTGMVDQRGAARLARIGCGSFAAHTYPGRGRALVQLGADLITWLYLFDDAHGEAGDAQTFAQVLALVRGAPLAPGASPYLVAMADLCQRIDALTRWRWRERFAGTLEQFFRGCLLEQPFRQTRQVPSLREYRQVKGLSVGALPVFALLELDGPRDEAGAAAMERLCAQASCLCAWVNDVFSFEKELNDGDPLNLIRVLAQEQGLTPAAAYAAAAALYLDDLARFEAHAAALLADPRRAPADHRFIRGVAAWIHGNLAWTVTSGRYARPAQGDARRASPPAPLPIAA